MKSANRLFWCHLPCFFLFFRLLEQVVDQYLGMYFLLDIKRRGVDDQIRPVLIILAMPYELRV